MMGNKIDAKKIMDDNKVPTVPGLNNISNIKDINDFIDKVELPIIVKAASGGGGKGMRVVTNEDDIEPTEDEGAALNILYNSIPGTKPKLTKSAKESN